MTGLLDDERSAPELFRELLRLLPSVQVEDYYANGQWDQDCIRIDIELLEKHREEAGAPEPPPLEDIPMVELPGVAQPLGRRVASSVKPNHPKEQVNSNGRVAMVAQPPKAPPPAALLRHAQWKEGYEMADFAETRGLDVEETKLVLSELQPSQRHWVMQNFQYDMSLDDDATAQFEQAVEDSARKVGTPQPTEESNGVKRRRVRHRRAKEDNEELGEEECHRDKTYLRPVPKSAMPTRATPSRAPFRPTGVQPSRVSTHPSSNPTLGSAAPSRAHMAQPPAKTSRGEGLKKPSSAPGDLIAALLG